MILEDKDNEENKNKEDNEEAAKVFLPSPPEVRTVALIGEVNEERTTDVLIGLIMLTQPREDGSPMLPIDFYISTYGGSADEMFSIYDMMKHAKKSCEIHTIGL